MHGALVSPLLCGVGCRISKRCHPASIKMLLGASNNEVVVDIGAGCNSSCDDLSASQHLHNEFIN